MKYEVTVAADFAHYADLTIEAESKADLVKKLKGLDFSSIGLAFNPETIESKRVICIMDENKEEQFIDDKYCYPLQDYNFADIGHDVIDLVLNHKDVTLESIREIISRHSHWF